ncbi:PEGA domain-containing protein [Deinococcus yavapaiensis]|uniref:PEGA domain-containing protein n=1 Tax=Deinococcus yavapaiensis TaxID=309889 RepID=UPI0014738FB9|nr:PEGA domain-containing protein [Deinococcus yavapaiensis]
MQTPQGVQLRRVDGASQAEAVNLPANAMATDFLFSRDGRQLFVTLVRPGACVIGIDVTQPNRRLFESGPARADNQTNYCLNPALLGDSLVFQRGPYRNQEELYRLDLRAPQAPPALLTKQLRTFKVAPNGSRLIVIGAPREGHVDVYSDAFVRQQTVNLTSKSPLASLPFKWYEHSAVSPDGATLYYTTFARCPSGCASAEFIAKTNVDTGETSIIAQTRPGSPFWLSPDGRTLASFDNSASPRKSIVLTDTSTGSQVTRAFEGAQNIVDGQFSLDGRYLLIEEICDCPLRLYGLPNQTPFLQADATLFVSGRTPGALLTTNGVSRGVIPDDGLEVAVSSLYEQHLHVQAPGYEAFNARVKLRPRETRSVNVPALARTLGALNVTSHPSGADIVIDGRRVGVTPFVVPNLPPGDVRVTVRRDGYFDEERVVRVTGNATTASTFTLREQPSVSFVSTPSGASIIINGQAVGKTPFVVRRVTPGRLTYTLRLPGYLDFTGRVLVAPDGQVEVRERLTRK